MKLSGRRAKLVPPTTDAHHENLYRLHKAGRNLWSIRPPMTETLEQFRATYRAGMALDFMVQRLDGELIGYVWAYSYEPADGFVYVGVMGAPVRTRVGERSTIATGIPPLALGEGLGLFGNFLFGTFPLRRLYVETYEHNAEQFRWALADTFDRVSVIPDRHYHNGRWEALTLWSTESKRWHDTPWSKGAAR